MSLQGLNPARSLPYPAIPNGKTHPVQQPTEFANPLTTQATQAVARIDSSNDGKFSFWEAAKNFAKGLVSPITSMFSSVGSFVTGAAIMAAGAALIVATGGAATPFLLTLGLGLGFIQGGVAAYQIITAENGDDIERAFYGLGAASSSVGLSVWGVRASTRQLSRFTALSNDQLSKTSLLRLVKLALKSAPQSASTTLRMIYTGQAWTTLVGTVKNTTLFAFLMEVRAKLNATQAALEATSGEVVGSTTLMDLQTGRPITALVKRAFGVHGEEVFKVCVGGKVVGTTHLKHFATMQRNPGVTVTTYSEVGVKNTGGILKPRDHIVIQRFETTGSARYSGIDNSLSQVAVERSVALGCEGRIYTQADCSTQAFLKKQGFQTVDDVYHSGITTQNDVQLNVDIQASQRAKVLPECSDRLPMYLPHDRVTQWKGLIHHMPLLQPPVQLA